jgi:hypothetical protein
VDLLHAELDGIFFEDRMRQTHETERPSNTPYAVLACRDYATGRSELLLGDGVWHLDRSAQTGILGQKRLA